MSLIRLIVIIIGIYLAYKFIFEFLLPIYRASKRMQEQFKGMQDRMQQPNPSTQQEDYIKQKPTATKVNKQDYIDFEEIK